MANLEKDLKLTITQTQQNDWEKTPRVSEVQITGKTIDELYGKVFREHDNRYKYCSGSSFEFHDEGHKQAYYEWISDVNNYANNGGDMW